VTGFIVEALFSYENVSMSFQIFDLLTPDEITLIESQLASETFSDGGSTAKGAGRDIKHNLQFGREIGHGEIVPTVHPATLIVDAAMRRHVAFSAYTLAKAWVPPSFSRYDTGMHYADHVDASLMRAGPAIIRTDFAMTLFLSPPDSYKGGSLVLQSDFGEEEIKLSSGQAVVYSCRLIHRVEAVTAGSRLVCLTWIQSHVADEGLRSVANDLQYLLGIATPEQAKLEPYRRLSKAYNNLLRSAAQGY
jgi:PKHD-type hydroxylase